MVQPATFGCFASAGLFFVSCGAARFVLLDVVVVVWGPPPPDIPESDGLCEVICDMAAG